MRELSAAGVDSVMLSWWGQADKDLRRDSQGVSTDELVPTVLDAAAAAGVGVSWHMEPYGGRTPATVLEDLRYLHDKYGRHPAVWRHQGRPLVWLYDVSAEHSGETPAKQRAAREEWARVMRELRGSPADSTVLSLLVDARDPEFVQQCGFDGAYSCPTSRSNSGIAWMPLPHRVSRSISLAGADFSSRGFTHGSTTENWAALHRAMAASGKVFVPSVGPGYNDTLIRPWNAQATKPRQDGAYYDGMWSAAIDIPSSIVTVTSFNEWGEGMCDWHSQRA